MRRRLVVVLVLSLLLNSAPARADYIGAAPYWPNDGVWFYVYNEPCCYVDTLIQTYCGYGCTDWGGIFYIYDGWIQSYISHNNFHEQPYWFGHNHYWDGETGWFSGWDGYLKAAWDCGDVRSDLNQEYVNHGVYWNGGYMPLCGWGGAGFTYGPGWGPFPFSALNDGTLSYIGVIRNDYLYNFTADVQYFVGYPIRVTSGYRNPNQNAAYGGKPLSRHQWGDAIDVKPASAPAGCISVATWNELVVAAAISGGSWFEPYSDDCTHLHVDLRNW